MVEYPKYSSPIGFMWVNKTNVKIDGVLDKYKAWLVANGYDQQASIDFFQTFAPMLYHRPMILLFPGYSPTIGVLSSWMFIRHS